MTYLRGLQLSGNEKARSESNKHSKIQLPCIQHPATSIQLSSETLENQAKIRERIQHVLNGCKCKTGCTTKRCKCKRQLQGCGPGCHCLNCQNLPVHQSSQNVDEEIHQMEVEDQDHHHATEEYVDDSDEDDQPEMNDGRLEIEWETPENQAKTRARI